MARPWILLIKSALIQSGTLAFMVVIFRALPLGPFALVSAAVAIAATLSYFLRLPLSWVLFNALLPPMASTSLDVGVPAWIFLVGFLLLLGFHLPAMWTHVPYYPTPPETFDAVLQMLPREKDFRLLELGSGVGALLSFLASERPNGKFTGVEISLIPYMASKIRTAHRTNVEIYFKSFWKLNFSAFDFLYAFLSPAPMRRLWEKFEDEAHPGAILISNSFEAPTKAHRVQNVSSRRGGTLFIYQA